MVNTSKLLPAFFILAAAAALYYFFGRNTDPKPSDTGGNGSPAPKAESAASAGSGSAASKGAVPDKTGDAKPAAGAAGQPESFEGHVVVTLGKVEDVGRQAAGLLINRAEFNTLDAIAEADRTPEQKRRHLQLQREQASALGSLEEIEGFQNNPDEYAKFFGSLLGKAAGLDEAQAASVQGYMRQRGQELVAQKLNAANEPTDPALEEPWEERRDAFNEETAAGAAKILPPGVAEKIGFDSKFLELMERDFDKAK
jgi:hypothetical protein